jgi:hypothetical protein
MNCMESQSPFYMIYYIHSGGVKINSGNLPQEPLTCVHIITEQKLGYDLVQLQSICVRSIRAND